MVDGRANGVERGSTYIFGSVCRNNIFAMQRHVWRHRDINTLDKGGPDLGLADAAPFTLRSSIEDSRSVATIGVLSGRASIKIGD
jgi:hypothetical protein